NSGNSASARNGRSLVKPTNSPIRCPTTSAAAAGDVTLNYRYQAPTETDTRPAIAPRVALVLPSADQIVASGPLEAREKSYGYELLLPVSKIVSDRVTLNGNAGLDPSSTSPATRRPPTAWAAAPSMRLRATSTCSSWRLPTGSNVNPLNRLDRDFE